MPGRARDAGEVLRYVEIHVRNRRTGKAWFGNFSAAPVRNEAGEIVLVVIGVRDITRQKEMELALRETEELARLAMQAGRMYAFQWDAQSDEVRRSYNCAEILGIPGDATRDTGTSHIRRIHPEDRGRLVRAITNLTPADNTHRTEYRVNRSDGRVATLHESARGFFDESGKLVRLIGMVADITERKHAEAALRESEERFRNMANTAPVMIWMSGPDKFCTFFNQGWLTFTGRQMEQELGDGWAAGVHPDDVERCLSTYFSAFDARRNLQMEYRLRRADGEFRWLLDTGVPRFEPDAGFAGYIGSCIDITDFKRAQQEALTRQKLESLGVMARGIAHDFNNLLGSILAEAELALTGMATGSGPEEELRKIKTVALRASEIVRELMTYSGNESISMTPLDVTVVINDVLHLLRLSISKHAVLKTVFGKNLPAVRANSSQIVQMVMNLITNASEAIGERSGVITITTSRVRIVEDSRPMTIGTDLLEGDYVQLEFSDSGCGMTEDVRSAIFDPFFTTKSGGRGLGLAVVRGIVLAHGGAITVQSAPDKGTTIRILLPCTAEPAVTPPQITATPQASSGRQRKPSVAGTVLVVDDEDILRVAVSRMLEKRGFTVLDARDGNATIKLFRAHKNEIGAILLDVTIPGTSSREVLAEVRRIRPDVKVILTTAYSREFVSGSFDELRVDGFIRKPYQIVDVARLLERALAD